MSNSITRPFHLKEILTKTIRAFEYATFAVVCMFILLPTLTVPANAQEAVFLKIVRFDIGRAGSARIYAHVNGTTYTFPNESDVQWLKPRMSAGSTKIPVDEEFRLNFSMQTEDRESFRSQETVKIKRSELPTLRSYRLFGVNQGIHSFRSTADVHFSLSANP